MNALTKYGRTTVDLSDLPAPLEGPPKPRRIRRFNTGQVVRVTALDQQGRIYAVAEDPIDDPEFAHFSGPGRHAKYRIVGQDDWRWDCELELVT